MNTRRVHTLVIGSGAAGLCAAVPLGTSVGAAVVLCAAVCYAVSLLLARILRVRLQA